MFFLIGLKNKVATINWPFDHYIFEEGNVVSLKYKTSSVLERKSLLMPEVKTEVKLNNDTTNKN